MIAVLFGQPGSGKTTLARQLKGYVNIDGDEVRRLFDNNDYSRSGRIKNLNRASDIANNLHESNDVVLSLVYPYQEARDYLNYLYPDVRWIYLKYENDIRGKEDYHVKDVEVPEDVFTIDTSKVSIPEALTMIKRHLASV